MTRNRCAMFGEIAQLGEQRSDEPPVASSILALAIDHTGKPMSDPQTYRECSEPFATTEEADDAVEAFWAEMTELRKRHKLANVYVVICDSVNDERFMVLAHCGDELMRESMAAYALGTESARRQSNIAKLIRDGGGVHTPKSEK